jgi:hypothetical protein
MNQAIAGVTPISEKEVTCMTVWPSVAGMSLGPFPIGRILGQLYSIQVGIPPLTVGHLICLLTIPVALVLYAKRIGPFVATRYRVTNKRIVVERGMSGKEERSIDLDKFESIEVRVRSGQEWFDAGDLVFLQGNVEKFILEGVSRPQAFRNVCIKSQRAYSGVQHALAASA